MGLDNGIVVRDWKGNRPDGVTALHLYSDGAEICYWRKCYGLRRMIQVAINSLEYSTFLKKEDVQNILKILVGINNKKAWTEMADSIWDYEDMIIPMKIYIKNLQELLLYYDEHPDTVAYFYDSY